MQHCNTNIYHETFGVGADLILLHGWGFHSGIWQTIVAQLATRYRVTVIDLPGFGRSPLSSSNYELTAITNELLTVAPPRAIWLGWSLGGLLAMHIAATASERVAKLVCVASSPKFVADATWPGMQAAVLNNFAADLLGDYRATLTRFLALQIPRDSTAQMKLNLRTLREEMFRYGEPELMALQGGLALLQNTDLRLLLSHIACPTLFMGGRLDTLVPNAMTVQLKQLLAQAKIAIITGAAHAPFLSHPDLFLQQLEEFLTDAS